MTGYDPAADPPEDYLGRKASATQCPKCGKLTILSTPFTFIIRGLCKDHR